MLYQLHLARVRFKLTMLVVIGADCIGSYKSNYHVITTTMAPTLIDIVLLQYTIKLKKDSMNTGC